MQRRTETPKPAQDRCPFCGNSATFSGFRDRATCAPLYQCDTCDEVFQ